MSFFKPRDSHSARDQIVLFAVAVLVVCTGALGAKLAFLMNGVRRGTPTFKVFVALTVITVIAAVLSLVLIGFRRLRLAARIDNSYNAFAFGVLSALPFIAFFTSRVRDTDSNRLIASLIHASKHGYSYVAETQEVLLPHFILEIPRRLGGTAALKAETFIWFLIVSGTVATITWKLSKSGAAAMGSALAFVSFRQIVVQISPITLYMPMLFFGYVGAYLFYRCLQRDDIRAGWKTVALSALMFVLCYESHGVGQLFLAAPFLIFVLMPSRTRIKVLLVLGAFIFLFSIPRIAVNYSDGGLSHFRSNRTDYFITNHYLKKINKEFWKYPINTKSEYARNMPTQFKGAIGTSGYIAAGIALVGFVFATKRKKLWVVTIFGFMCLALIISKPPPFPRYFVPILPAVAIFAGLSVQIIQNRFDSKKWLTAVLTLALFGGAVYEYVYAFQKTPLRSNLLAQGDPYTDAENLIAPSKQGVIGARPFTFLGSGDDIDTWGAMFLPEKEYVEYLSWPSDEKVLALLKKHNIGWIVLLDNKDLEVTYSNVWLKPYHNTEANHYYRVQQSDNFCLKAHTSGYLLYKVGACGTN